METPREDNRVFFATTLFEEQGDRCVAGPTLSLRASLRHCHVPCKPSFVTDVVYTDEDGNRVSVKDGLTTVDLATGRVEVTCFRPTPLVIEGVNESVRESLVKLALEMTRR